MEVAENVDISTTIKTTNTQKSYRFGHNIFSWYTFVNTLSCMAFKSFSSILSFIVVSKANTSKPCYDVSAQKQDFFFFKYEKEMNKREGEKKNICTIAMQNSINLYVKKRRLCVLIKSHLTYLQSL